MIKNKKFLAGAAFLSAVVFALAFGPVSHGGNPFPPDSNGGDIVAHGGNPFPPDSNGGDIVAHGGNPFPPDSNGGDIVA